MGYHSVDAAAREAAVDAGESTVDEPRRPRRAHELARADGTLDAPAVGTPQVADADETQL